MDFKVNVEYIENDKPPMKATTVTVSGLTEESAHNAAERHVMLDHPERKVAFTRILKV